MSRRRQTIARRLLEAQHSAAMLTTFNEIDMTAIMEARAKRKDTFKALHGVNLGFMSFFTKAVVAALTNTANQLTHPRVPDEQQKEARAVDALNQREEALRQNVANQVAERNLSPRDSLPNSSCTCIVGR